jgi:hypothetical protein
LAAATDQGGKESERAAQAPTVAVLEKPYGQIIVCEVETTPVLKKDYEEALKNCQLTLIASLRGRNKYERV